MSDVTHDVLTPCLMMSLSHFEASCSCFGFAQLCRLLPARS